MLRSLKCPQRKCLALYRHWQARHLKNHNHNRRALQVQLRSMCLFTETDDYKLLDSVAVDPNLAEDLHRMRVVLYPDSSDKNVQSLCESSSMQEIFDIFNSVPESERTEKLSSQALMSVWDIQKLVFRISHLTRPTLDWTHSVASISALHDHPTFKSIVQHVISHCDKLDDDSLAGCLLCLKRLQMGIRKPECQVLIEELLRRKNTLSAKALSRVNVTLRNPPTLYGSLIQAEFLPLLAHYVDTMNSDEDVKFTSIALRHANEIVPVSIVVNYRKNIHELYERREELQFECGTLSKILLSLFASQFQRSEEHPQWNIAGTLIRKYGNLLIPQVNQMEQIDILSMSKFMDYHKEPVKLLDALSRRISKHFQATPTITWLACLDPKNYEQQKQIGKFLNEYIDTCPYFEQIAHIICRNLKKTRWDNALYNKFWDKVVKIIRDMKHTFSIHNEFDVENNNDYYSYSDVNEILLDKKQRQLQVLYYAIEYLLCVNNSYRTFRHREFENTVYQEIQKFLEEYSHGKSFLTPMEYARCVAFLTHINPSKVEVDESFCKNFRIRELNIINRVMEMKRLGNFQVYSSLNRRAEDVLKNSLSLSPNECVSLAKVNKVFQRTFEASPLFTRCFNQAAHAEWDDSIIAGGLMGLTLAVGYYCPHALDKVSKFICDNGEDVPMVLVDKFVSAGYVCGSDPLPGFEASAKIIEKSWETLSPIPLLSTLISLNFHGCLSKDLITSVFSLSFLDSVDKQMDLLSPGSVLPIKKIRRSFMELNRAVCIDQPHANVPWFHKKYCEEVTAMTPISESYLHREVGQVLGEVLGSPSYILKNSYSPYFHHIDFLLQFDGQGHPIKAGRKPSEEAVEKVAVIIKKPKDYTTNVRRLKGTHQLQKRHLEILGYKVITIDPFLWNTMHMSEKLAKNDYLESSIFTKKTIQNGG